MTRGKFITLEGIDGAGKSTHVDFLCELLRARGVDPVVTREPGGTSVGEKLRELVLRVPVSPMAEALLMFAARVEHLTRVIEPALGAGRWVLCDRFTDATYAYQCGGRGLSREAVRSLEGLVHPHLQPDVTFLFDVDPSVAWERQQARGRSVDRFENEGEAFFARVRDAYLERARADPRRFRIIDASGSIDDVRARLRGAFDEAFA